MMSRFETDCIAAGIGDIKIALAVRQALAKAVNVETDDLEFGTPTREILRAAERAHWDGWDDMGFVFAFEDVTGCHLNLELLELPRIAPGRFFFWKWPGAVTLGEWCKNVVPVLKAAIAKKQEPRNV
jgi:hypothetical protein